MKTFCQDASLRMKPIISPQFWANKWVWVSKNCKKVSWTTDLEAGFHSPHTRAVLAVLVHFYQVKSKQFHIHLTFKPSMSRGSLFSTWVPSMKCRYTDGNSLFLMSLWCDWKAQGRVFNTVFPVSLIMECISEGKNTWPLQCWCD